MARADYVYTITSRGGRKVLVIEDQDLGRMSVTNCIEDVVAEICTREKIVAREYVIVYMDSEYKWGGW
ncbi:MAG TPA: hypothetical protein VK666_14820, partial [Chryseolinea sp.]|nr:hypothetical protein [Chryseolinea sp.]